MYLDKKSADGDADAKKGDGEGGIQDRDRNPIFRGQI